MNVGNRVIFDQSGKILFQTGESSGNVLPHSEITELHHMEIPYGSIDYGQFRITGIDIENMQPVLESTVNETEDQKRIRELEDALLMQAENEIGGIL